MPMIDGSTPASRPARDPAEDRRAAPLGLLAVISTSAAAPSLRPGGVGGGDGAVLLEGRAQAGDDVQRGAGADIFVLLDDRVALAALDRDRRDLVPEAAGARAASALFWLATANSSCSSRVT